MFHDITRLGDVLVRKRQMPNHQIPNDSDSYNKPDQLPRGFAALSAIAVGIMGAVVGMAQLWFVGPIGKNIGPLMYGADIGFELSGAFASIVYLIFRTVEKRAFGA